MVFTCQKHKSLESEYIVEIPCGKLRKLENFFQRVRVGTNRWKGAVTLMRARVILREKPGRL